LFLGPKLETYMNTKLHKLLPISAAALLFASMATTAMADETVKIGHVAPLTGGIAHLGKDNENGARLAVEEINAKGLTIGGQKITLQLDPQDDAGDPRTATQVAQKLVDDKVVGVVGHLNSGTSIPASKMQASSRSPRRLPTRRTRSKASRRRIAWSRPTLSKVRRSPTSPPRR
jgi:branched-chain amino acid transport system substrate-binding protein